MGSKDQFMLAQDVSSIDRHCMAMIHLCLRSGLRWPVTAGLHGAAVAVVVPGNQSQRRKVKSEACSADYTPRRKKWWGRTMWGKGPDMSLISKRLKKDSKDMKSWRNHHLCHRKILRRDSGSHQFLLHPHWKKMVASLKELVAHHLSRKPFTW